MAIGLSSKMGGGLFYCDRGLSSMTRGVSSCATEFDTPALRQSTDTC